jgi:TPR repeat protein
MPAPHPTSAMLVRRKDLDRAEAAFRRAHERGHPGGTYNLGLLLAARDHVAAETLLRRAAASPDGRVAGLAAAALKGPRR